MSKPTVLFVCVGNSCRSQMAEGWARELSDGRVEAMSAGTHPKGIDPRAIKVMEEADVDISQQHSKGIDDLPDTEVDCLVTVCDRAREMCPAFPGDHETIHRNFEDPPRLAFEAGDADEALKYYRQVRDEVREFVQELVDDLLD